MMQLKYVLSTLLVLSVLQGAARQKRNIEDTTRFAIVEEMPEPGYNFSRYLQKNLHYPDSAREHSVEGRVIIKFLVNEDGSISDCTVEKSVDIYLDEEALRVIRKMPPWKPGRHNGEPVKVYTNKALVFRLE